MFYLFFFFQAEDGIRDAQESRGLGDVYKRQVVHGDPLVRLTKVRFVHACAHPGVEPPDRLDALVSGGGRIEDVTDVPLNQPLSGGHVPVSYTHLTLPTKRIV
eukprot:TRINITY_DN5471_c0_g1_i3.p1 TRINITY_DN5471_c0_g1~~TRINITY_DN5471_c0_g1_i3.p1  ORF type:complete len:103 (+),score=22.40 TRINITY_DN5471_c0_g1_i3:65-373(+)